MGKNKTELLEKEINKRISYYKFNTKPLESGEDININNKYNFEKYISNRQDKIPNIIEETHEKKHLFLNNNETYTIDNTTSIDNSSFFKKWNIKPEKELIQNIGVGYTISLSNVINMNNGNKTKTPIICRNYDKFINTIQELYGPKPEIPTIIPVSIVFQFELNEKHYNLEYKVGKDNNNLYNDRYCLFEEKRPKGYDEIPDSGFSCIKWLIENNYIPSYYTIYSDEDEVYLLMKQTLDNWMTKNNFCIN